MANFGFLEYSFNPDVSDKQQIYSMLNRLGFVHRSQHHSDLTGFWIQNSTIISLRETDSVTEAGISGIGLIVDREVIDSLDAEYDHANDMFFKHDGCGLRVLLITEMQLSTLLEKSYNVIDRNDYVSPGLEYFSGMIYNCVNSAAIDFYQQLGFKFGKLGKNYNTMTSNENRFSLLLSKTENDGKVTTVICDTNDVFRTTSCYAVTGVPTRKFEIDRSTLNFGTKMNYKIVGYNCAAFGNTDSYTIENYIDNAAENLDLIFRMRKQHLHITEQTLDYYAVTSEHS